VLLVVRENDAVAQDTRLLRSQRTGRAREREVVLIIVAFILEVLVEVQHLLSLVRFDNRVVARARRDRDSGARRRRGRGRSGGRSLLLLRRCRAGVISISSTRRRRSTRNRSCSTSRSSRGNRGRRSRRSRRCSRGGGGCGCHRRARRTTISSTSIPTRSNDAAERDGADVCSSFLVQRVAFLPQGLLEGERARSGPGSRR